MKRRKREDDLEREFRDHLELEAEEQREAGASADDARLAALRAFGNVTLTKEDVRAAWGWTLLEQFAADARYALRALNKQRKFVAAAALTLALGIGASTTIFSVTRGVLLHAVDAPRSEDLFYIFCSDLPTQREGFCSSQEARWVRREAKSFSALALTIPVSALVNGGGDPFNADGVLVSGEYFEAVGVQPELGRFIRREDDVAGGERVVVLSHHLWTLRFGSDPGVVGRPIEMNGKRFRVLGVAGPQFGSLFYRDPQTDYWVPEATSSEPPPFVLFGRLRHGVTVAAANWELGALEKRAAQELPELSGTSYEVLSASEVALGETPKHLRALAFAVGVLLLLACINVSGLLLTRVTGRRGEISLRLILGASRLRLGCLVFFEALMLSLLGAAGGAVIALASLKATVALGSSNLPGIERVRLDGWALLFALAVAVMAAVLGSVVPAAIAWRNGSASNLNWARRGSTHSGLSRAGALFVALQFAAGLILLTGSAILLNNFIRLVRMPLGFDPDRLLVMEVSIPYGSPPRDSGFRDEILRRLRLLRGVQGAAIAEPGITEAGLHIDIRPPGRSEKEFPRRYAPMTGISPGFFQTMHIPVLEGRDFTVSDARLPVPPIIIDEGAARLFWPNRSAVGMDLMMPAKAGLRPSRIVGVVRTAPIYGVHYGRMRPQIYTTLDPEPGLMQFLVRTVGEHAPAASKLRQVVRDVEPRQPVESVATLQQLISDQVVPDRFYVYLSLAFSIVAVIIACAGLHGLLHYVVASRKHEIGIRIAVGATAGNLVALLSGFGLRAALAGMAMGLAGSYAATRLLGSLLYAIKPDDAPTFAAAALIFTAVALLTCIAPLRAMLRVDPAACLRCE